MSDENNNFQAHAKRPDEAALLRAKLCGTPTCFDISACPYFAINAAPAIAQEVHIAPHDSRWASQFAVERERLLALLPGHFSAIEHVGSTAVAGLAAKPIIDLLAGVTAISETDALLEPLSAQGYETSAEFNATLPDRRWLMRHAFGKRTHHLHLVVFGGERWIQWVQFRDLLRADAAIAARYEQR